MSTFFQLGTLGYLLKGKPCGETTIENLQKHGDFGLGTFNYFDGEMILIDNVFYQIDENGNAKIAEKSQKTFFANICKFNENPKSFDIEKTQNSKELEERILEKIEKNYIYAIRIDGFFSNISLRSLKKVDEKSNTTLIDAIETHQNTFSLGESNGSIITFYIPAYLKNVCVDGLHMHFIDKTRKRGGHLLDVNIEKAKVTICPILNFSMQLLKNKSFENLDHSVNAENVTKIEKGENL
jgi:acetolactate decarboxylase